MFFHFTKCQKWRRRNISPSSIFFYLSEIRRSTLDEYWMFLRIYLSCLKKLDDLIWLSFSHFISENSLPFSSYPRVNIFFFLVNFLIAWHFKIQLLFTIVSLTYLKVSFAEHTKHFNVCIVLFRLTS